jgi:hypothetical protein
MKVTGRIMKSMAMAFTNIRVAIDIPVIFNMT